MNIAALIPCLNKEATIEKAVSDFKKQLPGSTIHVYDNDSSDRTPDEHFVIIALLLFCCGLILDNLSKYDKHNFKQLQLHSK